MFFTPLHCAKESRAERVSKKNVNMKPGGVREWWSESLFALPLLDAISDD